MNVLYMLSSSFISICFVYFNICSTLREHIPSLQNFSFPATQYLTPTTRKSFKTLPSVCIKARNYSEFISFKKK